jgi:hypothetical protein
MESPYLRQLSGNVLLPSQGSPRKIRARLEPLAGAPPTARLGATAGGSPIWR